MIEIKARTSRTFTFPASVPQALEFFSNFRRITEFLTHISLVREFEDSRYRLLYSTVELSTYEIHIFADVATTTDWRAQTITVLPTTGIKPVKSKARLRSLRASGSYSSQSFFRKAGERESEIEYVMELGAVLPRPPGLSLVPTALITSIADNITHHRMEEIIDGFIARSIQAYFNSQEETPAVE